MLFWGSKVKDQGYRVNKCIFHTNFSLFVCLSVCLSVCPKYNSETNDSKVFKLDVMNDLLYPTSDMVLG